MLNKSRKTLYFFRFFPHKELRKMTSKCHVGRGPHFTLETCCWECFVAVNTVTFQSWVVKRFICFHPPTLFFRMSQLTHVFFVVSGTRRFALRQISSKLCVKSAFHHSVNCYKLTVALLSIWFVFILPWVEMNLLWLPTAHCESVLTTKWCWNLILSFVFHLLLELFLLF